MTLSSFLIGVGWLSTVVYVVSGVQVTVNTPAYSLAVGKEAVLSWSASSSGPIPPNNRGILWLAKSNGDNSNMIPVTQIATNLRYDGNEIKWTVPNNVTAGNDYTLQWRWAGQDPSTWKYSKTFAIEDDTDLPDLPDPPSSSSSDIDSITSTPSPTSTTTRPKSTRMPSVPITTSYSTNTRLPAASNRDSSSQHSKLSHGLDVIALALSGSAFFFLLG